MPPDLARLLAATTWRAFDADDRGRVLAGCDASGSTQLVELDRTGPRELTALPGAVHGRYLVGRRAVVVQHDTDGDERTQLSLLQLPVPHPAALSDLQPLVRAPGSVHRLLDTRPDQILYTTNRRTGVDFDVVLRDITTGEERVLYDRGGMVQEAALSPSAGKLALTVPAEHSMSEQLLVVDLATGEITELTARDLPAQHHQPTWLPDESGLVVTTNVDREFTGIARYDLAGGRPRWLVTADNDLTGWPSPDGTTLLVRENRGGASRLSAHDARTGERLRELPLPEDGWVSGAPPPAWSPDSSWVAFSFSAPRTPGDVLLVEPGTGTARQLTSSADQLPELTAPRAHQVPARDGARIPCFVYTPTAPDPRLAGSAVLLLHGGPENQAVQAFSPVVQALCANGHTVLVPNVRGSTGYGRSWYSADDKHNRLAAVADLADLHDWLPRLGVDPERAALWGGSYGGYLVLAGLAFQPDRWSAGVALAGISSLVTFLRNTAPYRRAHREREYGSLQHDLDFLHRASPLGKAEDIRAPLLVVHGANDPRVPLSEAVQLAEAVRANGTECELLVYPDEGHGLAKKTNRLDAYSQALEFLRRHLARG